MSSRRVQDELPASNEVPHGLAAPTPSSPHEQSGTATESPPSPSSLVSSPWRPLCHTTATAVYDVSPPTTTIPSLSEATAAMRPALRRPSAPLAAGYGDRHECLTPRPAQLLSEGGTSAGVMRFCHPPRSHSAVWCNIAAIAVMRQACTCLLQCGAFPAWSMHVSTTACQ